MSHTGYAVVNVSASLLSFVTYSNLPLMLLRGGVKSIYDRFRTPWGSVASPGGGHYMPLPPTFLLTPRKWIDVDLAASLNALGSFRLLDRVTGGAGCGLHLLARSSQ